MELTLQVITTIAAVIAAAYAVASYHDRRGE